MATEFWVIYWDLWNRQWATTSPFVLENEAEKAAKRLYNNSEMTGKRNVYMAKTVKTYWKTREKGRKKIWP